MEWISVNDQLPEEGKVIIIYGRPSIYEYPDYVCKLGQVEVEAVMTSFDQYAGEEQKCLHFNSLDGEISFYLENITHWMPLPDPPECNPGDPHCNKSPSSNG